MFSTILLVAAFIIFILAAIASVATQLGGRVNLLAAGLACWVAAQLFGPMLR
jgi:hypothetical protein